MRYVALLRGINVGGNSVIRMAALRACVEELGLEDVATYIASGNVLFRSAERPARLEPRLERAIEERFGLPVRLVVRSAPELAEIVRRIPPAWRDTPDRRVTVAFLLRGADAAALAAGLKPKEGIDELVVTPTALLWVIRSDALTRTGLRLVGTPPYRQMTLRNLNTTLRLAALLRDGIV